MLRPRIYCLIVFAASLAAAAEPGHADDTLEQRADKAVALLDGAEGRFQAPDPSGFETTRHALAEETHHVGAALDSHGEAYAAAWKSHLRWPLLTGNLGSAAEVELDELALVRRWLYSNRKGLEYPFFAELRQRTDAHLDAVFALTQPDLEKAFHQQVVTVRQQILELAVEPNDARVADLGRTLGWLERTNQLPEEVAAVRSLLSFPNAQIVVTKPLIDRVVALLATEIEQTLPVSDHVRVAKRGMFSRARTAAVNGIAHTKGEIGLDLAASSTFADMKLVYRGEINSRCRAIVGPVTVAMQTVGPVRAITPVQLSLQGVQLLATEVLPKVRTRVTGVQAESKFIRWLGERRVRNPESIQQMNSRAANKAATLLQQEMDARVATVLEEIQTQLRQAKASLDNFQEVLAPVVREGAAPHWHSLESSAAGVTVNIAGGRREQLGAVTRCPPDSLAADVQVRIHASFFNNMAETIMAGKTFTDSYFMNYGKILQAQLPPALMVHARSKRWSMIAAKPRPLEIAIPAPNQIRMELRMQRVTIAEDHFTGPTVATINYVLAQNEYDEYQLERQGEVLIDSPLPEASQDFLLQKLNAFFAPVLSGGGVALPEGGALGRLRILRPSGVYADRDWLALGVQVPTLFLKQWLPVLNNSL